MIVERHHPLAAGTGQIKKKEKKKEKKQENAEAARGTAAMLLVLVQYTPRYAAAPDWD